MGSQKSTEIEKKTETALAKSEDRRGHEDLTEQEDFIIPRAQLVQKTSPIIEECPGEYVPGDIVNSLTREKLPAFFIPLSRKKYWIRFNPRQKNDPNFDPNYAPGDLIWKTDDPNDPRVISESKFGEKGEKPAAAKVLSFLAYFPGVDMPVVIPFSKTSLNAGRALNTLTQTVSGPMFSSKYKIGAKKVTKDDMSYMVLTVTKAEKPTEEEYKQAEEYFNLFATRKDLKVDEGPEDDAASEGDGDAPF